jgi:hypothetical protein
MQDKNKREYATMLWFRDTVGPRSKLGAFIVVLGTDISKWVGKKIKIVSWTDRNREIMVV